MKVSEVFKIVENCDSLRSILLQNEHELILTSSEIQEICDLLWDYRAELLNKEVD